MKCRLLETTLLAIVARPNRGIVLKSLGRFHGRSMSEFRFRGIQALAAQIGRLSVNFGFKPDYRVGRIAPDDLMSGIDTRLSMLGGQTQRPETIVEGLGRFDRVALESLRYRTRQLRAGCVQLLGLPELNIGSTPNWHRDPVSGLIAPTGHWSQIPYLDSAIVGDHKSLWELNRHQYLFAPAMVWLADDDDADFKLVQRHLVSWLDENPPSIGVNWASSLEVAYRAITWCWLLWLLKKAPWEPSALSRLGDALERSGLHVERFLSVYFSPNTHLTGEALGLFYLGSLLPACRHADRWRTKGAAILEGWLARQVHPDGVYTEQATLYQRYTAEIYLHYVRVAQANRQNVSASVTKALHGQFDVLRTMAAANAELPLIGDDDGGQIFPLDQRLPEQVAGVLLAGATALARPELVPTGACYPAISYALCGVEQTDAVLRNVLPDRVPAWRDRYFADGGVAVLRDDWTAESAVAVVDAGPHGVLNCGHAHADALAMTLALGPVPVFIDRGTLTYVGAERNEFRSTASHNTLELDGGSSVTPRGQFHWGTVPERPAGAMRIFEEVTIFGARAPGHADSACRSEHRRVVAHAPKGAWVVLDHAQRPELVQAVLRWQLAPGLSAILHEGVLCIQDSTDRLVAEVAILGAKSLTQSVRDVSLRYGHRTPATVIEAVVGPEGMVTTLIVPASGRTPVRRLKRGREPGASVVEWVEDSKGRYQLWAPDAAAAPLLTPFGVGAEAQVLWMASPLMQGANDSFAPNLIVALGARRLSVDGIEVFVTKTPDGAVSDVVAGRDATRWTILPGIAQ